MQRVCKLSYYIRENIKDVQLPPNPNELDMTCLIFCPFKNLVSGVNGSSCIFVLKRRLGYIMPCFIASTENTASIPPLAPKVCPVNDLVELMGGKFFSNKRLIAVPSALSLL